MRGLLRMVYGLLTICLPQIARAEPEPSRDPLGESRQGLAFERCGGGPIQDGHDVQPTPDKDACLRRQEHVAAPAPLALPPDANGRLIAPWTDGTGQQPDRPNQQ